MSAKQTTTSAAFLATLKRDLLIAFKKKNDIVNPFMFFIIVVSLFPIGISPESDRLTEIVQAVRFASIGPVTSETARELGLTIAVEAQDHTAAGVVGALVTACG